MVRLRSSTKMAENVLTNGRRRFDDTKEEDVEMKDIKEYSMLLFATTPAVVKSVKVSVVEIAKHTN